MDASVLIDFLDTDSTVLKLISDNVGQVHVPPAAWDMGQSCDWVWRLANGSRVHVQCFEGGSTPSLRFHVDKYDPDAGLVSAIKHLLLETPAGPMLAMAGFALLVAQAGE